MPEAMEVSSSMVLCMANVEELLPDIENIARVVASDYPDIDWRDVRQHLCLFVLEKKTAFKVEDSGWGAKKILKRVAQQFCKDERNQQNYLSAQYSYRPSDVTKILETAWSIAEITDTYVPEDAVSVKNDADPLDLASDVRQAYESLPDDLRASIFSRYALGEVPLNASYERKKLNKAVKELTRILNTYRGSRLPFRRRVISNAKANALISKGY